MLLLILKGFKFYKDLCLTPSNIPWYHISFTQINEKKLPLTVFHSYYRKSDPIRKQKLLASYNGKLAMAGEYGVVEVEVSF